MEDFLIEAKTVVDAASIRVERAWLEKISHEARHVGRDPALAIRLVSPDPLVPDDWIMVPARVFEGLIA